MLLVSFNKKAAEYSSVTMSLLLQQQQTAAFQVSCSNKNQIVVPSTPFVSTVALSNLNQDIDRLAQKLEPECVDWFTDLFKQGP
jgi:hypothetical protein